MSPRRPAAHSKHSLTPPEKYEANARETLVNKLYLYRIHICLGCCCFLKGGGFSSNGQPDLYYTGFGVSLGNRMRGTMGWGRGCGWWWWGG